MIFKHINITYRILFVAEWEVVSWETEGSATTTTGISFPRAPSREASGQLHENTNTLISMCIKIQIQVSISWYQRKDNIAFFCAQIFKMPSSSNLPTGSDDLTSLLQVRGLFLSCNLTWPHSLETGESDKTLTRKSVGQLVTANLTSWAQSDGCLPFSVTRQKILEPKFGHQLVQWPNWQILN